MNTWSYILREDGTLTYVMTNIPLGIGEYIELNNTLGFIERSKSGWLCFVNYNGIKCFGEEPNISYAKTRVQKEYEHLEKVFNFYRSNENEI